MPVTLRLMSSLLMMAYAAARCCTCRAEISSAGSSLFTMNLRMGWAHEGVAISTTAKTVTWTRVAGPGGGGLESAAACCVDEVPGRVGPVPGPGSEVSGPSSEVSGPTAVVPELGATAMIPVPTTGILVPSAGALESDPATSGGAGTKIESDSSDGLTDGLRRRWRATPDGIA